MSMKSLYKFVRLYTINSRNYCVTENLPILSDIKRSSPISAEKEKKEPFMKNVFHGKFDNDFLLFPEIKEPDLLKELSLKSELLNNSLSNEGISCLRDKLTLLAKSGLFSRNVPKNYGGLDLLSSEIVAISENLGFSPSLSLALETQQSLIIQILLSYGSVEIKKKFLSRILAGEIFGAYALIENNSYDPLCLKTSYKDIEGSYVLNGEKRWVSNADLADFFIVFAKCVKGGPQNNISAFIVEKNSDIEIRPESLSDPSDFSFSRINFERVSIPANNIIGVPGDGFQIALERLKTPKFFISSYILTSLKEVLSQATNEVNLRHMSPNNLKNFESEQYTLAKIAGVIYALESMVYFTSVYKDLYDIDMSVEAALLHVFSCEEGLRSIATCINLVGSQAYDISLAFDKKYYNLSCLSLGENKTDVHKMYAALTGLEHAGQHLRDDIIKARNPLDFPFFVFKKMIESRDQFKDKPKLTLKLFENLHPTMKVSSEMLEYCVFRFKYVVSQTLVRHGAEIRNRHLDLNRIFRIALDIYAMTCVLSRASRSYCSGIRNSDNEVQFAKAFCLDAYNRTKRLIQETIDGGILNNDVLYLELSDDVLNRKSYFLEHPLKRNIV